MLLAEATYLGLHWIDWLVLAAYLIGVTAIGVWSYKKVKNMSDFFMGGRRFGKVFMMFFAFGAGTSSEQAISVVAGTWRAGLAGIWWQFLWLFSTPFYWIVAPVLRRMRALTTADFFEARFNTSTATLYTIYGIIMAIVFIAAGLYGSGKMVNALTGGELERVAQRIDYYVPEIKWDGESNAFGRGILFQLDAKSQDDLNEGRVPEELANAFAGQNRDLSEIVSVAVESGSGETMWKITDVPRGLTYPARLVTVTEDDEEIQIVRVYGSLWRRVQGYEYAILAMTVMFLIYGMAGGLGAAIITDFIQGILTITFSFLLLPFVFAMFGGFGELHSAGEVKTGMFELFNTGGAAATLGKEDITVFYVFMLSITALAGIVVQPHIMGVCGAGKTEFEGRFGFTFGNFMKRFCTIAWTFTGLACIVWYMGAHSPLKNSSDPEDRAAYVDLVQFGASPEFKGKLLEEYKDKNLPEAEYQKLKDKLTGDLKDLPESERKRLDKVDSAFADELFGRAAYYILPAGLVGLLLASLLAAVMSTSDAQMVVSSGLFTENIYRRFVAKERSQRHYLWVGRLAGLVIVVFAVILQSTFTDVIHALKIVIKTPAAIGISLWFGIVWRRWTSWAVWISTITAAVTWALVAYQPLWFFFKDVNGFMFVEDSAGKLKMGDAWQSLCYLSAGVISGVIASLLTPRAPQEKLDKFYALLHTPVTPGEETEKPCTLPENPAPQGEKLFQHKDLEFPRPTWVGIGGFVFSWICVALIIRLTKYLATAL